MKRSFQAVSAALDRAGLPFPTLPRGELFLLRDYLARFPVPGGYFAQLEAAARSLGLSLVGVDLDENVAACAPEPSGLENYFVVGRLNGPVSRLIESWGFLRAMTSLRREPGLFKQAASLFLSKVQKAAEFAHERGFGGLAVTDDIAGKDGLLFSPRYLADQVLPVYGQAAQEAKRLGLRTFFHSDGDMKKAVDLLTKAGYECIHPIDAAAGMDVFDLAEEFGEKVCFMGHIDVMGWREEKIRAEVDRAEVAFCKGGLILGSSCGISTMIDPARLNALYPGGTNGGKE